MGQSASLHGAVDGDARVAPTDTPLCPSSERNRCLEMEAMVSPPASSTLPYYQSGGSGKDAPAAAAAAAPTTTATASPASASLTSVFCLDVSKQSLLLLRQLVETPAPDRASTFQALATHSKGILLNAPASTTIQTLQAFLLSHTREQEVDRTTTTSSSGSNSGGGRRAGRPAEHPSSMHVFALHDPTVVVRSDQGPVVVTREMSTDLLIPLTGAMELSALGSDATVLAFAATPDAETCTPVTTSAPTDVSEDRPPPRDGETGKRTEIDLSASTVKVAAPRTILLLYTRDARFGFDGGDMMLIGCCVAICACIAAAICCCVSSAQKNKQQQSSSANNGKQDYYNGNSNNNNYNNNNNGQYYSNNGNSNNEGYYNQPNGNYGNPYAGNGYSNNTNTNSGAPNGYGVPPNAYDNSNNNNYQNYQPQYQPQQQPQQNNVNSGYYGGGSQQPSGPAPL